MPTPSEWRALEAPYAERFRLEELPQPVRDGATRQVEVALSRMTEVPSFDAAVARLLFLKYLTVTPNQLTPVTVASDYWSRLPPSAQSAIYWLEIDQAIDGTRSILFRLASEHVRTVLTEDADLGRVAQAARQLIEVTDWAAHYQFCITSIGNAILRILDEVHPRGSFFCGALEGIVRSLFSVAPVRMAAGHAAIGSIAPPEPADDVGETTASVAKQGVILRHMAESCQDPTARKELVAHCDRLANAYAYLSGFAHVTPLLASLSASEHPLTPSVANLTPRVSTQVALSSLRLLEEFVFHRNYLKVRLWTFFRSHYAPNPKIHLTSKLLESLRSANDRVRIPLRDGEYFSLYDPRGKKRPSMK